MAPWAVSLFQNCYSIRLLECRHASDNVCACIAGAGIENWRGVSPHVHLSCEPWGQVDHSGGDCECLSSDRTGAYVHDLALMPQEYLTVPELEDASVHTGGSGARMNGMGAGRLGSVPFVSHRPDVYGHLLLAVYM